MDRRLILNSLSDMQDRVDYIQRAGRIIWSRVAQDEGRETLEMAIMMRTQLDQARQILNYLTEMNAFHPTEGET